MRVAPELENKVWDVDVEKAKTPVSQACDIPFLSQPPGA